MKKICEWCGAEFETNTGKQKYCKGTHYGKCIICGSEFVIKNEYLNSKERPKVCSKKCRSILRKQTCNEKYGGDAPACSKDVQAKIVATNKERFGVEHPIQSKEVQEKAKQTCLERYGCEFYSQTEQGRKEVSDRFKDQEYKKRVQESAQKTNLEKYGVECIFSLPEIREKAKQTYKEKTGYEYSYQNPEVLKKVQEGSLKKFGTAYPMQSTLGKEAIKKTTLERYGVENCMQNEEIKEKARATNLDRYGVDNYAKTEEFQQRFNKTMLEKYGVEWYAQTDFHKLRNMKDPSKFTEFKEFDKDPASYLDSHYSDPPRLLQVANDLGVGTEAVSLRVARAGCKDKIAYVRSTLEKEVIEFIQSLDRGIIIEENTHKVITPKEIDIYLPEYKIGIECNPASTHNSSIDTWDIEKPPMSWRCHQAKSDECEERGVFLFHIFGYDWLHNEEIIKSMIRNLLGRNQSKLYARKCIIQEVNSADASKFLKDNHRQGAVNSPIRLGLYFNEELVSLMTFGKMRSTIGIGNEDLSDCYELVRFCSKLNTSVIGGADKLFKHFIRTFHPTRIRSFSDRAHTRGLLYSSLGFKEVRRSDPNYVWVNLYNDRPYHRINAQKAHIKEFLNDDTIDLNKTEKEIMETHNYVQVFDSGTITWEWTAEH